MPRKTLTVKDTAEAEVKKGFQKFGDPDMWKLLAKASNDDEGWMKSTKALAVSSGVVLQVSTQQGSNVTEALCFVPRAELVEAGTQDGRKLWKIR